MKPGTHKNFLLIVRLIIGGVFVYAGFSKLMEPYENALAVVQQYQLIPPALHLAAALVMPWLELFFGAFLLLGYMMRFSSWMIGMMSGAFIILLAGQKFLTGSFPMDCGCFGEGWIHLSGFHVLLLDIVIVYFSTQLFKAIEHKGSIDHSFAVRQLRR